MRGLVALVLTAAMAPLGVSAHDLDEATPYGVVRVDEATVHQQVIEAQLACRNHAYGSAPRDAGRPTGDTTGGLAIGVVGDWRGALTETDFIKDMITECMGLRGFGPIVYTPADQARFHALQAAGRRVDPYAVIAGFGPAVPRVTTMLETPTASGMSRTYTVGRF
jgi:hypothetical protein